MAELTFTVAEAAAALGLSPALVRRAIREGRLPHITIGRRLLIPKHALDQWLLTEATTS